MYRNLNFSISPLNSKVFLTFLITVLLSSCGEETLPKPKASLRLSYPSSTYITTQTNCPFSFEISNNAKADFDEKCWVNIRYPKLNASLDITYRKVDNNIKELLRESEKLTYNHAIKADGITPHPFENAKAHKYGAVNEVTGNAASPLQFYITDSSHHFITGALYFDVQPNYDSILPAVKFIEKDIIHLMETLEWKNN